MDFIVSVEQFLIGTWEIMEIMAVIVASSTAASIALPNSSRNPIVNFFLSALNFLAGNIFRNRNKDDRPVESSPVKKRDSYNPHEFGGRR